MKTFEDVSGECRDINKQIATLLIEHQNLQGNIVEQLKVKEAISLLQQQLTIVQQQIRDNYM
jgi:hypothetical protein